jgi:N-acetyl sugar amidotransferase
VILQVCTYCVMDTTDPEIQFDAHGRCNHCVAAVARMEQQLYSPLERDVQLNQLVEKVKISGRKNRYDCIIGVSGGCDSTMTAYSVKKMGLRPLAVHFDNGWNSELAVSNIRSTLSALDIDLVTYVVDWNEFRDIQLSFLASGVPNCEIPTDHGITSTLFRTARKENIKYILSGSNLVGEAIMPKAWGHYNQDLRHIKSIHRRFGTLKLKTMPTISLATYLYSVFGRGLRQIPYLNYVEYEKEKSKAILSRELNWRDYGGKHYESVWTRFFQGYYLPTRFGFDKRKAHLSSLICSNQITREEALKELNEPIYPPELLAEDKVFVAKKFGLTELELDKIVRTPGRDHKEYPGNFYLFVTLEKYKNLFRKIATTP